MSHTPPSRAKEWENEGVKHSRGRMTTHAVKISSKWQEWEYGENITSCKLSALSSIWKTEQQWVWLGATYLMMLMFIIS